MKKPIKSYAVSGRSSSTNWLPSIQTFEVHNADVVVFPGGADISPALYHDKRHPHTHCDLQLDVEQVEVFNEARKHNKKMVGICRGAQLLCALAGGKLVQHMQNARSSHPVMTYDGKVIEVSSDHHQAMFPWYMAAKDFKVLGWSLGQSTYHEDGDVKEIVNGEAPLNMEVEIAFFPKINALCIQSHPEWQYPNRNNNILDGLAVKYLANLFERFFDGDQFEDAHRSFNRHELMVTGGGPNA